MKSLLTFLIFTATLTLARAQIVYSGPQSVLISSATFAVPNWVASNINYSATFQIDFDNDGLAEIGLFYAPGPVSEVFAAVSENGAAIEGIGFTYADRFVSGQNIGPILPPPFHDWHGINISEVLTGSHFGGQFIDQTGFFGVQFQTDSGTHYGWVEVHGDADGISGEVLGWAYNETAGSSILAGDTGMVSNPPSTSSPVPEPSTYGIVGVVFIASALLLRRRSFLRR